MQKFTLRKDGLMLGLGMAMAISPAVAMQWADWVPGLWVLQTISLYSVIAGFFLAKSRFSPGTAFLMSVLYGLFTVGLFSGLLLPSTLDWQEKIPQLITRQLNWAVKAASVILDPEAADTSRDGLIFIMHTGLILWAMGFATAWYTFRRLRIWHAILPSGILLLITVTNYYGNQPLELVLIGFLFVTILYIIGSHYLVRERDWIRSRVVFNRGTQLDFLQIGFLIALLALTVAWSVPNVSAGETLRGVTKPWDPAWQRVQDGWTQLFASLKSYGGEYSDPYGNTLALGGPRQITPKAIMDVNSTAGRYWRGTIYDTYTGDGWTNTAETTLIVPPDQPLTISDYLQRQPANMTVTSYLPNSALLYFPHQPERTDQQAKFTVFDTEDISYDIISSLSRYIIYEGKNYKTWGSISTASDDQLRRAGTDYPDWVRERYLQLAPNASSRVVDLAAAIANPHPTHYDKVEALTDWLRTNITYNETVEAPPVDVDPLEYLLFESKEGYCNYYASALTVMARSQGIPARIAAGYARGEWLEDLEVFRVNSTNSHTWVEVFFPNFGWVEFEPTTPQPRIVRTAPAAGEVELDANAEGEGEDDFSDLSSLSEEEELLRQLREDERNRAALERETRSSNLALIIGSGVLLTMLAASAAVYLINRSGLVEGSVVAQAYERMSRFGRWLGVKLLPTQTPYERARVLTTAAPEAAAPIDVITGLYVEECFRQVPAGRFDHQASRAWNELWPALLKKSLLNALSRFQRDKTKE